MKVIIVLSLMMFAVNATSSIDIDEVNEQEWLLFKSQFNKLYKDEKEEVFRKNVFLENKLRISEHNELYEKGQTTYKMGINQFSDLKPSEFVAKISCLNMPHKIKNYTKPVISAKPIIKAPSPIDWREHNRVTPVKNQGDCGSCWAFSATGALEGQYAGKHETLISLSEQNLIDCAGAEGNKGCHGGWMDNAFKYVEQNGGLDSEDSYPYDGFQGDCRYDAGNSAVNVQGFRDVDAGNEDALAEAVSDAGPVSVGIDATQRLMSYESGVFYDDGCSATRLNHGVLVVGFGADESGRDYWIVKNSWGATWGQGGYALMARNRDNNCGIATSPSYPLL